MKRIVYIGNNLSNTNPTSLIQLKKILKEIGFEVVVYSNKGHILLRLLDMCWGVIKHRKSDYLLIDTYSTLNFYYAVIVSQLARFFSLKYIPILHGGNLAERLHNSQWFSKLLFNNSYRNISPSKYLKEKFQLEKIEVDYIPNSINIKNYRFKKRTTLLPKLLWVRAFHEIYNPLMAIEVIKLLKPVFPKVTLCMVGPDKDGSLKKVKLRAQKYNLLEQINFTGKLSKEEWVRISEEYDIFINTTTVDNMPVSVIEAMALGLPVVSTDAGGIPYLISNGENGYVSENKNPEAMANLILELLNNNKRGYNFSLNAREMVCEFDIEFIRKKWKNLLK